MPRISISNMVCPRCIMAVEGVLKDLKIPYETVKLGSVDLLYELNSIQAQQLKKELSLLGFSIPESREIIWVESVKTTLIQLFDEDPSVLNSPISEYLKESVGMDYNRLNQLFSDSQGKTIAQYFIELKLEKAKEWLSYEEFNISQIAWKLGYSSVQYFSTQFKKNTGLTPSEFKKSPLKPRKYLDSLGGDG